MGGFHAFEPSGFGRNVADRRQSVDQREFFGDGGSRRAQARTVETPSKKPAAASNKPAGLKPGQYEWHPDRSPSGPLAIIVSLTKQRVYIYRNGIQIGVSTCSTGKKDHETPTGVFTILEKEEEHYSNTLRQCSDADDAAADLGRHRASRRQAAGISRVAWLRAPAEGLRREALRRHPTRHASDHRRCGIAAVIGLRSWPAARAEAKDELGKASKKKKKPTFSKSNAVTSILVSSADKSMYVIQNGDIVAEGKAEIADPGKKLGSNVFILEKGDEDGFTWQATGYSSGKTAAKPSASVVERVKPPADVQAAIDERMKPGMVFITTDQPATPETRSGKDFTVMDSEGK